MDYQEVIEITRTVKQRWAAVTGAHACMCGHTHHGRQLYEDGRISRLAPQYGFCDNRVCPCSVLRQVKPVVL